MPYTPQVNVYVPPITTPTLGSNFSQTGGSPQPNIPYWWQDGNRAVHIGGVVNGGSGTGYQQLWTASLPAAAQPVHNNILILVLVGGISVTSFLQVTTAGVVNIYCASANQTYYLEGANFLAGI